MTTLSRLAPALAAAIRVYRRLRVISTLTEPLQRGSIGRGRTDFGQAKPALPPSSIGCAMLINTVEGEPIRSNIKLIGTLAINLN